MRATEVTALSSSSLPTLQGLGRSDLRDLLPVNEEGGARKQPIGQDQRGVGEESARVH
jgi:hypothetical protein